jgi:outer membrane protein assembly factor BamB
MSKQQEQEQLPLEDDVVNENTRPLHEVKPGSSRTLGNAATPHLNEQAHGHAKLKTYRFVRVGDAEPLSTPSDDDRHALEQIETGEFQLVVNQDVATQITAPLKLDEQPTITYPVATIKVPVVPQQKTRHTLVPGAAYPIKQLIRLRNYSRPIFVAALCVPLLILLIGVGVLEDVQLQQVHQYLYMVNAQSGKMQWQLPVTKPVEAASTNGASSLLIQTANRQQEQLVALDADGNTLWSTSAGQGNYTYSLPDIVSPPGTVLVEQSGQAAFTSATGSGTAEVGKQLYAPLQSPFMLSLLNRATGKILMQRTIVAGGNQFGAVMLGGDSQYVYVAFAETGASQNLTLPGVTLLAIQQETGAIAWSVQGPPAANNVGGDTGKLLLNGQEAYWQIAGRIYALNSTNGKILWNHPISESNAALLPKEEAQMLVIGGMLIVERSTNYYEFDAANGSELGSIPLPGEDATKQNPSSGLGMVASGTTLVIYGDGQIAAYNVLTKQELWNKQQLNTLQSVTMSNDDKLLFVLLKESIKGSQPAQALVAMDISNGTTRWTFQPSNQVTFLPLQATEYIENAQHVLLASVCLTPLQGHCTQPNLYALNAETGATLWKYENYALANVSLSANGSSVIFERSSSGWLDLLGDSTTRP